MLKNMPYGASWEPKMCAKAAESGVKIHLTVAILEAKTGTKVAILRAKF